MGKDVYQEGDMLGNSLKSHLNNKNTVNSAQPGSHWAGNASGKPYSELKLDKKQKKMGGNAVARLWQSDKMKLWWMQNLGLSFDQINQIRTKFRVPFIYTSLAPGKECFLCQYKFPFDKPL